MRNRQVCAGTVAKRLTLFPALLCLLCASLAPNSFFGQSTKPVSPAFLTIAPGVEHLKTTRGHKSDNESTGPWAINLLRFDLKQTDLRVVHALDEGVGLETTSSIASRYGAIAAVNAGFFRTSGTYRGEPAGVLVLEGKLISEPIDGRAAFGVISTTEIIFGHLRFSGTVESVRGRSLAINGLNRPRGDDELILYTPEFHRTTLTASDGVEVIVLRGNVSRIVDSEGSSRIPANGFVISASGRARDWVLANLRVNSRIGIKSTLSPVGTEASSLWKRAAYIVGGGPQLIKDGRISITYEEERIAPSFATNRHPRTAIGKLKDGRTLLATVDGRQPAVSVGMTLTELASLLLEFGVVDAINLDGGGSTTMIVRGKRENSPSDQTGERPVSDAILVLPKRLQRSPKIQ